LSYSQASAACASASMPDSTPSEAGTVSSVIGSRIATFGKRRG
jgi:hypothetical protein